MLGIFPKNDDRQTLRLKRFFIALASYLMWWIIAFAAFLLGIIPGQYSTFREYLFGILLCNFIIYALIRSGYNKRLKDPSLTLLQMMIATFWIMVFAYSANTARSIVLLVYLIVFVFGLFRLNVRQYLFLSVFAVVNYAVVIVLLLINHPESINRKMDILNIMVLAMVLPWFSMVGGYITGLRAKANQAFSNMKEAELKFRTIFDFASDGILLVKISDNRFYAANQKIGDMTGYAHDELLTLDIFNLHPQNVRDFVEQQLHILQKDKTVSLINVPLVKKDRAVFFADISASLMTIEGEEYFLGMYRDTTERKETEELIKKSEERYRLLADHMKDQIWLMDLNLNITYISPSVERSMGYSLDEFQRLNLDRIFTPDSLQAAIDFFSVEMPKALAAPPDYVLTRPLELEFVTKEGRQLWGECMFGFIRDENGKPISVLGEARDITDRKKMEDRLRFEEERFRALVEHSSDIVVHVNREGLIIYINPAVERLLGFSPEERIGHNGLELFHPDDVNFVAESFLALISDRNAAPITGIGRLRHKNGGYRYIEGVGSNLVRNDVVEGVILNYRDVTERTQAEERLQKTLESLKNAVGTTIQVLVTALEARDPYTAGHQSRTAHLACAIAQEMNLSENMIEGIQKAGIIHDIGKLSVPAEILTKPSKLTKLEFSLIKEHSRSGFEMLKNVESPWPLAEIIYQHHERINGSGYPRNMKGDEILLEARILAVSDVVESMASHRPYRSALGIEAALEEIEQNKGILYDVMVVDACLRLFREKGYKLP